MPSSLRHEVILVHYPFTDLSAAKVRPAVVVHAPHVSMDHLIVPLTSQTATLTSGEFVLSDWRGAGLNVLTAVKRGIFTIHPRLVVKRVGKLVANDGQLLDQSLRLWLSL
jgi:mRNA interferase MazF